MLFLDDYEAVSDPAIHRDVNLLLSVLPRHVTLAVASRVEPAPSRSPGCAPAAGLLELQASDLRFTLTMARYYLTRVQSLDLTEDQIREVTRKTEGRISGLQLAAPDKAADGGRARCPAGGPPPRQPAGWGILDAGPCGGVPHSGARAADQDMMLRGLRRRHGRLCGGRGWRSGIGDGAVP